MYIVLDLLVGLQSTFTMAKSKKNNRKKRQTTTQAVKDTTIEDKEDAASHQGRKRQRTESNNSSIVGTDKVVLNEETTAVASSSLLSEKPDFPFETNDDDHCESPIEAYRDIALLLQYLSTQQYKGQLGSTASSKRYELTIYDPYYCNGGVIANLAELGFDNVHNVKQDCYKVWQDDSAAMPNFDCLVTNPPYSADHIEKLMQFVTQHEACKDKPWFLLMPTWVHKKDYYTKLTSSSSSCDNNARVFYLVPRQRRYIYKPPPNFRNAKVSDVHKKSSPFTSMWYIHGGQQHNALISLFHKCKDSIDCDIALSKSALRDLRRKKR